MAIHERPGDVPLRAHSPRNCNGLASQPDLKRNVLLELQRRVGNRVVTGIVQVQRAKWTWNGSDWVSPDGDPQNKPTARGSHVGETYDDQTKLFALPPTPAELGLQPGSQPAILPVPSLEEQKPLAEHSWIMGPTANTGSALGFVPGPMVGIEPLSGGPRPSASGTLPKRSFRNLGLTISIPGHQSSITVNPSEFLASQQKTNFPNLGGPDVAACGIEAVRRLPNEAVAALAPTAFSWFHGSTSPSLALLSRTRGLLLAAPQLMQRGLVPFGGELGNALDPQGINRRGVSGVTGAHINEAVQYTDPSHGRTSTFELIKKDPDAYVHDLIEAIRSAESDMFSVKLASLTVGKLKIAIGRQYLLCEEAAGTVLIEEIKSKFARSAEQVKGDTQISLVKDVSVFLEELSRQRVASDEERKQLATSFPVLYGSPDLIRSDRAKPVNSSIPGEYVVDQPLLGRDIAFVFVPSDVVEVTTRQVQYFGATALPLEAVTFLERVVKATGCSYDAAAKAVRAMS